MLTRRRRNCEGKPRACNSALGLPYVCAKAAAAAAAVDKDLDRYPYMQRKERGTTHDMQVCRPKCVPCEPAVSSLHSHRCTHGVCSFFPALWAEGYVGGEGGQYKY